MQNKALFMSPLSALEETFLSQVRLRFQFAWLQLNFLSFSNFIVFFWKNFLLSCRGCEIWIHMMFSLILLSYYKTMKISVKVSVNVTIEQNRSMKLITVIDLSLEQKFPMTLCVNFFKFKVKIIQFLRIYFWYIVKK